MRRALILALVAVVVLAVPAWAARGGKKGKPAALEVGSVISQPLGDLRLGGTIWFETVVEGVNGNEWPMIQVDCSQGDRFVWTALRTPEETIKLGGDASSWVTLGGPAICIAYLLAFGNSPTGETIRELAVSDYFTVEG